jgi:ABC-type Fe3+/spermidine/putrescine transport system ATPase subunit
MSEVMIELRNLTKRYGRIVANESIQLSIMRGELMTLLGPSGCGKTTALRCITGQVTPDEGQVFIDGADVTDMPTHRRQLGMVFQNFALFPHMTVEDNVGFPLMIRGLPAEERRERVMETLRLIRMESYAKHYPRQLSGGQQQRVGLARALVYRPKVLLLDEPLSNLDAKLREEMRFEIRELVNQLNITAVYVTHDQEEALALADRVAIMRDGEIRQIGSPWEIYKKPKTSFIAEFVGTSNFITGEKINGKVRFGRLELAVADLDDSEKGTIYLAIRPENIELVDESASPEKYLPSNVIEVEAEVINFLGAIVRVTFILEEEEMLVDISEKEFEKLNLKRKDRFKLYFPPDEFHQYSELFRKLI